MRVSAAKGIGAVYELTIGSRVFWVTASFETRTWISESHWFPDAEMEEAVNTWLQRQSGLESDSSSTRMAWRRGT